MIKNVTTYVVEEVLENLHDIMASYMRIHMGLGAIYNPSHPKDLAERSGWLKDPENFPVYSPVSKE